MKKCKHCQTEIDDKAKVCPNCKKKQGLPTWLIVIIVIILIVVIVSALPGEEEDKQEQTGTTEPKKTELELLKGHKGYADEYGTFYYIEGTVKNNTDKDYSYVDIEFNVYDKNGNNLGSCYDNNSNLEANGTWKFKAVCDGEANDITRYKLVDIDGY